MAAFASIFIFVFFETLLVPFTMDQYAWDDGKAVFIVSIITSCSALVTMGMYGLIGPLTKRFDERKIIILGGFLPLFIGNILFIPYGNNEIPSANCTKIPIPTTTPSAEVNEPIDNLHNPLLNQINYYKEQLDTYENNILTFNNHLRNSNNDDGLICGPGCPPSQEWCDNVPQLALWQLIFGMTLIFISSAISRAVPLGLFSKILGPNPQQLWMALMAGLSTTARIIGPIIITFLYTQLGTYWLFGMTSTLMGLSLMFYFFMYKWLVPMKALQDLENTHFDNGNKNE